LQDRYTGDVGDFIKLALLRALQPGRTLGVAWWLFPDESHNGDGRHISYLQKPDEWRALDPDLYDGLARIVASGKRSVSALQEANFLPGAVFWDTAIPTGLSPIQRRLNRASWYQTMIAALANSDLVFVDPDNGLETSSFSLGTVAAGKSVSLKQLSGLARHDRTLIVYHHQTRRKGGHLEELRYWAERLRGEGFSTVDVVRAKPFSPRAFFILDGTSALQDRAKDFVLRWGNRLAWYPDGT
jgi:hypothetical protein